MKNRPAPAFGTIYGCIENPSFITDEGIPVWMWRKGQRVRFFTANGKQIGPEQRNVVPAVCAAFAAGWSDPNLSAMANFSAKCEVLYGPRKAY